MRCHWSLDISIDKNTRKCFTVSSETRGRRTPARQIGLQASHGGIAPWLSVATHDPSQVGMSEVRPWGGPPDAGAGRQRTGRQSPSDQSSPGAEAGGGTVDRQLSSLEESDRRNL